MSRNEEFSTGSGQVPPHLQGMEFHGSHPLNRAGIEKNGLRAGLPENYEPENAPPGVWTTEDPSEAANYGTDIYAVDVRDYKSEIDSGGGYYTPHAIPASRVKRVAHVASGGEIHWHKEEQCPPTLW